MTNYNASKEIPGVDWTEVDRELITGGRPHTGEPLRVCFANMQSIFDCAHSSLFGMLRARYDVVFATDDVDVLFYSIYSLGDASKEIKAKVRVQYITECMRPVMEDCDLVLSYDYLDHPRHRRLPIWVDALYRYYSKKLIPNFSELLIQSGYLADQWQHRDFCSILLSNPRCIERNHFVLDMLRHTEAKSGGRCFNNIFDVIEGGDERQLAFLSKFRYNVAFENAAHPGYTTEKIIAPMLAGAIPIYWGDPEVARDFNADAFITRDQWLDGVRYLPSHFFAPKLTPTGRSYLELWRIMEWIEGALGR